MSPRVEFLYWEECPSWERALDELREQMTALGLDPSAVRVAEVRTEADAERERFAGSPTIRVDGADVQDPGTGPARLVCRIYRRRDGRISPLPDPEDVRDALARSIEHHERGAAG